MRDNNAVFSNLTIEYISNDRNVIYVNIDLKERRAKKLFCGSHKINFKRGKERTLTLNPKTY